jgi:peroxidase
MRSVYESVDDVDLYVAGLAEKPLPNAALGPTFAGIFAAQFLNLRRTDRFFYDHNVDGTTRFSSSKNISDIFIIQRIIIPVI